MQHSGLQFLDPLMPFPVLCLRLLARRNIANAAEHQALAADLNGEGTDLDLNRPAIPANDGIFRRLGRLTRDALPQAGYGFRSI